MDPISISASAAALLSTIFQVSISISGFVRDVRDARKDMDQVSRELSSLTTSLSSLRDDSADPNLSLPPSLEQNLLAVVQNCSDIVRDIEALLSKVAGGGTLKSIYWTMFGRADMEKLRSNLEAHKSAFNIALDLLAM